MKIKEKHKYVDPSGRVFHPYLASWTPKNHLLGITQHLQEIFGIEPPLFSKQEDNQPKNSPSSSISTTPRMISPTPPPNPPQNSLTSKPSSNGLKIIPTSKTKLDPKEQLVQLIEEQLQAQFDT